MFCAVEIPDALRARFAEHAARLRASARDVRASWERPEKIHVTLKFVGEIEERRARELSSAAERAAAACAPFTLSVGGAGTFPPRGAARVLWLGVEDVSGGLARAHKLLEDECAAVGFPRETRDFHPHVTVARLRTRDGAQELADLHRSTAFAPYPFQVSEIVVMHSELGPGGSKYTAVTRHVFAQTHDS